MGLGPYGPTIYDTGSPGCRERWGGYGGEGGWGIGGVVAGCGGGNGDREGWGASGWGHPGGQNIKKYVRNDVEQLYMPIQMGKMSLH